MDKHLAVITAVGSDRIGIVDDFTSFIEDKKANIQESRMAVLGGEFAVIMLVSGQKRAISGLIGSVEELEKKSGLRIEIKPTIPQDKDENSIPYLLECVSLDSPGLVHSVTRFIRQEGINIEDLETETTHAPWTGAPPFQDEGSCVCPHVAVCPENKGRTDPAGAGEGPGYYLPCHNRPEQLIGQYGITKQQTLSLIPRQESSY